VISSSGSARRPYAERDGKFKRKTALTSTSKKDYPRMIKKSKRPRKSSILLEAWASRREGSGRKGRGRKKGESRERGKTPYNKERGYRDLSVGGGCLGAAGNTRGGRKRLLSIQLDRKNRTGMGYNC